MNSDEVDQFARTIAADALELYAKTLETTELSITAADARSTEIMRQTVALAASMAREQAKTIRLGATFPQ